MIEFVLRFLHDHVLALLGCTLLFVLLVGVCHRRMRRWRQRDRHAQEVEDALLQNAQGLILKVHGIVKGLAVDDPMRQRVEQALDRADEQLSEDRDRVQDLRSQQPRDDNSRQ